MRRSTIIAAGAAAMLFQAVPADAQVARFSAQAIGFSGPVRGEGAIVEITISRWSTEEEGKRLIKTFTEKGQREMLAQMQKINSPVGRVQVTGTRSYHLRYAAKTDLEDGGHQILIEQPAACNHAILEFLQKVDRDGA